MKNKTSKYNSSSWLVNVAGFLIVFALVGSIVFAGGSVVTNNFYGETSVDQSSEPESVSDDPGSEEPIVGIGIGRGSRFVDSYLYAGHGLIADDEDGFSIGTFNNADGATNVVPFLTDGYVERLVTLTITNTSSAGILNPEGETIYVYDASYRYQTATTSATFVIIGTSTKALIVPSESALDFPGGNGGDQSIFKLETNFPAVVGDPLTNTATSTVFMADNQGKDTRDASGIQYVIPVKSTEYLTCYASTTVRIAAQLADTTMGTFQGQCQIKYYVIED